MIRKSPLCFRSAIVVGLLVIPTLAHADTWHLWAGARTADKAGQALAFLPSEIWVHAGDTVTWTMAADDAHTVTCLRPEQVRPPLQVGCPGSTPDGSIETAAACVNSGVLANGTSYGVAFPIAGNFKTDRVHSGFISAAPQDRIGLPQPGLGPTRFRVTFTTPGVYNYICSLHDDLGMRGQVVVVW